MQKICWIIFKIEKYLKALINWNIYIFPTFVYCKNSICFEFQMILKMGIVMKICNRWTKKENLTLSWKQLGFSNSYWSSIKIQKQYLIVTIAVFIMTKWNIAHSFYDQNFLSMCMEGIRWKPNLLICDQAWHLMLKICL